MNAVGSDSANMTNRGKRNMIVLKDYTIKEQNGIYYIITSSTPNCPDCGGELKTRDSKKRKLISSDGTVDTFALRRYKCRGCGRVQMEFPDIMVPHKHYSRSAIIDTINGEQNCAAEQSTIYRWNKEKTRLVRMLLQEDDATQETSRTGGKYTGRFAGN